MRTATSCLYYAVCDRHRPRSPAVLVSFSLVRSDRVVLVRLQHKSIGIYAPLCSTPSSSHYFTLHCIARFDTLFYACQFWNMHCLYFHFTSITKQYACGSLNIENTFVLFPYKQGSRTRYVHKYILQIICSPPQYYW